MPRFRTEDVAHDGEGEGLLAQGEAVEVVFESDGGVRLEHVVVRLWEDGNLEPRHGEEGRAHLRSVELASLGAEEGGDDRRVGLVGVAGLQDAERLGGDTEVLRSGGDVEEGNHNADAEATASE